VEVKKAVTQASKTNAPILIKPTSNKSFLNIFLRSNLSGEETV